MPDYGTNKKLVSKEVNYLGRDFKNIRENLIEFAKLIGRFSKTQVIIIKHYGEIEKYFKKKIQ